MSAPLIHIGFPKTGSTFLQKYFLDHPLLKYLPDQLSEYDKTGVINLDSFCEELDYKSVLSSEQLSVWSGGTYNGDSESDRLDYDSQQQQKYVAEALLESIPNAGILIVIRSPRSVLVSVYSQYISKGGTEDFVSFLNRLGGKICRLYNYQYIIEMYQAVFGHNKVLVLPFELLVADSGSFLRVIEEFFEIKHHEFNPSKVNRSIPLQFQSTIRMVSSILKKVCKMLPAELQDNVFECYLDLLYSAKEKWFYRFHSIKKLSHGNEVAIQHCIKNNYRFYVGLRNHSQVLPFVKHYELESKL